MSSVWVLACGTHIHFTTLHYTSLYCTAIWVKVVQVYFSEMISVVKIRPTSRSERLVEEALVMNGGAFQTYTVTPQERLKFFQFSSHKLHKASGHQVSMKYTS